MTSTYWVVFLALLEVMRCDTGICNDDICYWQQSESLVKPSENKPTWIPHSFLPFEIASTELTVLQYKKCVEDSRCSLDNILQNDRCSYNNELYPDHYPLTCVDWEGCSAACNWAGGRLCKESEWSAACKRSVTETYPYGSAYIEGVCNLGLYAKPQKLAAPGSFRGCEGGMPGVYDMLGNVGEWLDEGKDNYRKFKASSFAHNGPLDLNCSPRCGGNQKSFKTTTIGCRCCKDQS